MVDFQAAAKRARRVGDIPAGEFARQMARPGLTIAIGPFTVCFACDNPSVAHDVRWMYAAHPVCDDDELIDLGIEIRRVSGLRRWVKPQVRVAVEGVPLFNPLPAEFGSAAFEWSFNIAMAGRTHQHLVLHAGVVARDGRAVVLPAEPGAGKSTLSAALMASGWRLFSDESTVFGPDDGVIAVPRPVMLKGPSTRVIRTRWPDLPMTPPRLAPPDVEGPLCLLRPTEVSVVRAAEPAWVRWIVFPRFREGASTSWARLEKGPAFIRLVQNAFNYTVRGLAAFEQLTRVVDRADCYAFEYSNLDEALAFFERLAAEA
jgi:hypothetical protein